LRETFVRPLIRARRVLEQGRRQRGRKVCPLHAPQAECIDKGKRRATIEPVIGHLREHHRMVAIT
jgi:hypothetical protein